MASVTPFFPFSRKQTAKTCHLDWQVKNKEENQKDYIAILRALTSFLKLFCMAKPEGGVHYLSMMDSQLV